MPIVVGITLRTAGKLYYFNPGTVKYLREERVLVETARGLEIGIVKLPPHEVSDEQIVPPLKEVLRRATPADLHRDALNRERETHALEVCKRLTNKYNLPMRLIDAQYTFDSSHVLIHFLADNRVDFRELVRELAHELHTRIELRQVGVRDEAKLLGGYGLCGRQLCCATFLPNFAPVAINLAKEQGLALNPQKISGMCGRLMCCLTFEHECYKSLAAELPALNTMIETARGTGRVTKLNVLARQVEVSIPDIPGPIWFTLDQLPGAAGKAPVLEACCTKCPGKKSADAIDFPMFEESYEEESIEAESDDMTPVQDASPASGRRRPRRRRKRPAGTPPVDGQGAPPPAQPARAADAVADGQQPPAAPRRRRSRPHKPRTPQADAPPVPVRIPVPTDGGATSVDGQSATPSGRYRPRKRR